MTRTRIKQTENFLIRSGKDELGFYIYFEIKDEVFEIFREIKRLFTRQHIDAEA